MSSTIDQHKYLKKYLSNSKTLKKRKRVKKKDVRVNIIDDDLDLATFNEAVTEDLTGLEVEDAPQIVGVTDERPLELRVNDYKTDMWKSVTILDSDEEDHEMKVSRNESDNRNFSPSRVKVEPRDYDNSPPRRNNKQINNDNSAPNRRKVSSNPSDDDNSPPRKRFNKSALSIEYKRKNSKSYIKDKNIVRNTDNSPLRHFSKKTNERINEAGRNPQKKVSRWQKDDGNGDCSPSRRIANRSDKDHIIDTDDPHRNNNESSDNDNNPPRESHKLNRHQQNDSTEQHEIDNSPRRKHDDKHSSRRTHSDRTVNPRRRHKHEDKYSSRRKEYGQRENDESRDNKSGKFERGSNKTKSNGSTSKSRDNESEARSSANRKHESDLKVLKRLSDERINSQERIDLDFVGNEAHETEIAPKTIVRDRKTGRIRNLQEEAAASKEKEKEKEALVEKYSRWGKGLKQVDDANEKRALDLHEMQKPLARYADDADLENMLKNRDREGDPMLEYLRKKRREKALKDPDAKPEKPVYQGDNGPSNRYSIKPGYRWDGVNRSNGFENKYFEVLNARRAHQTESYKWSSEDM